MNATQLFEAAKEARAKAYAPYSGFSVGAALLSEDGSIFCGCNVENRAFTPTCCAERVALFKAVSEGARRFCAIAIAGGKGEEHVPCYPCGVCRQALSEFCSDDLSVIVENASGLPEETTLGELLPNRFAL